MLSCYIDFNDFYIHGIFSIISDLLKFVLWLKYDLSQIIFHECLKKTHILLLLCEGFYIFQLDPGVGYFSVIYFADFLSSSSINC